MRNFGSVRLTSPSSASVKFHLPASADFGLPGFGVFLIQTAEAALFD